VDTDLSSGFTIVRIRSQDLAVAALLALLTGQLLLLSGRLKEERAWPGSWLSVGDDFSGILVADSGRELAALLGPGPTLLLVFGTKCSHCATVAPTWKSWLDDGERSLRALAVSTDPIAMAESFAARHDTLSATEYVTGRATQQTGSSGLRHLHAFGFACV